jgi:hypothetical protein
MINMKIKIIFSDRLKPEECDALLNDDIIKGFLMKMPCGFCCRLYKTDIKKDGFRAFISDPAKPCIFIKSFEKVDDKWYGDVDVPEPYQKYMPLIKTGYIHPVVMMDGDKPSGIFYFEMMWINGKLVETE